MLRYIPRPQGEIKLNDLIAITKDEKFIGYITVEKILPNNTIMIDTDKKVDKMFNEIEWEHINYSFIV